MYLNSKHKNSPKGIGFGDKDYFRVFLSSTLNKAVARRSGMTFDRGGLVREDEEASVVPTIIEIWGFGGSRGIESLKARQEQDTKFRKSRRQVDKAQLMEGGCADLLFEKTLRHRQEVNER